MNYEWLTVFSIVEYLGVLFDALVEGFAEAGDALLGGERPAEELAGGGTLHHLGARVSCEAAEAVRTVDDVALSLAAICDQK